ncbi:MAG: RDD family protein [Fimbriimonadaceae bacterium]|nr:RDD family protein [Fimbriimonadaceae bacterium]
MDTQFAVLTPDKALVTYRIAGLGTRAFAHILDAFIVGATLTLVGNLLGYLGLMQNFGGIGQAFIVVFSTVFPFAYFVIFEALMNGQTLGKKATRVRVRMADGTPITWQASFARNMLRVADFLPVLYGAGIFMLLTSQRSQRVGDVVANTIVLLERQGDARYSPAPHTAGIHPLEQYVGELRDMTVDEYNALRRFADRFPEFPARVQSQLVQEVWIPFATRHDIPVLPNVHPVYLAEAVVMRFGRQKGLL